jgi:Spy/CpxP family protein refolding chaperone
MKSLSKISFIVIVAATSAFSQSQTQSAPANQGPPPPRHHMMEMGPGMPMMGIPGDWWRNSDIAQELNLSDQQVQALSQVFSDHRTKLIDLRASVEKEEGNLRDLLDQDQPQQDQVLSEVAKLQGYRNALETEFTVMSLGFRSKLNPDQWKKLRAVSHEHMRQFGHHRGGPEGNPPPPPPQ